MSSGPFSFRSADLLASKTANASESHQGITEEVCNKARDRFLGRILQLSPMSFALDVGLRGVFLFVSADPSSPRFYLIQRRLKDLEKQSIPLSNFGQQLRNQLGSGRIVGCEKDRAERVVRLTFRVEDDLVAHFRRLWYNNWSRSKSFPFG
jgi:predicted ribosome quality control (RQC) complex YloA/Tae2 family protein